MQGDERRPPGSGIGSSNSRCQPCGDFISLLRLAAPVAVFRCQRPINCALRSLDSCRTVRSAARSGMAIEVGDRPLPCAVIEALHHAVLFASIFHFRTLTEPVGPPSRSVPQTLVALRGLARVAAMPRAMGTKSREVIWGGQIMGAEIHARHAREEARKAARKSKI
jgi:hypothetical protein